MFLCTYYKILYAKYSYLAFMKPKTTYTLGVIVRRHRIIPGGSWHIITNIKTPKNYKFGKPYGPGDIAILTVSNIII